MAKKKPDQEPFDLTLTADELSTLANDLCRDVDDALSMRSSVIADGGLIDLADWFYEQGRSQPQELPFHGAADLTSYFITENVSALRARLMKTAFGVRPFCFVEGWGMDAAKAPFVEEFLDWQVRKSELKTELSKTIHGALIEDGYVLEVSEKTETRKYTDDVTAALETGPAGGPIFQDGEPKIQTDDQSMPVAAQTGPDGNPTQAAAKIQHTYTKTKRLGPQYDAISMKDFVFLPGHAKSRKETYGYAYRIWKRVPELTQQADAGIYDADAVEALGDSSDRGEGVVPKPVDAIQSQYGPSAEKELFQLSLLRDLDGDGLEEWYVATISLKTRAILRLKKDAFAQRVGTWRCVPFILFPRRNSVYGYSYAFDQMLTLAEEHTALRNMIADRSGLATNAPIMQVTGGMWDADAQPIGVGAVITVRDMQELKQLQFQDVPPSAIQRESMLHQAKERVGGLSDSAVGILSGERRTLGENKLVAGGSAVRVDEVIGHLHLAIADVMRLTHAIWVDTLKTDTKGVDAPQRVMDALKGRGAGDLQDGKFTAAQLDGNFQFEPYGSDDTADPQRRRSDFDSGFVALSNMAKAIPGLVPILQNHQVAKAILEQWMRVYEVRDRGPFMEAFDTPIAPPDAGPMGAQPPGAPGAGVQPSSIPPGAPGLPPVIAQALAAH